MKVVTIEEVRELRLHENWIPMVTRSSFQPGVQEVTLFDLLKSALRQRPEYIIVGEVRGEEAYTLFQSIAVGHGGLCSIHADSEESVLKRLLSRPMNIPEMMLPLMNVIISIKRVKIGENVGRRVDTVSEVIGMEDKGGGAKLERRFQWNADKDVIAYIPPDEGGDNIFNLITKINQTPFSKLVDEMEKREVILRWMANVGIRSYEEVSNIVRTYYLAPDELYNIAKLGDKW
jgi:flagellar protein FlaI